MTDASLPADQLDLQTLIELTIKMAAEGQEVETECDEIEQRIALQAQELESLRQERHDLRFELVNLKRQLAGKQCVQCASSIDAGTLRCLECDERDTDMERRLEAAEAELTRLRQQRGQDEENTEMHDLPGTTGPKSCDEGAPVATEVQIAERIARQAHAEQKDSVTGAPYITHVERVVAMVAGADAKAVAWLHDVLEDSDYTYAELRRAGISERVLDAVQILTRQDNRTAMVIQTYEQYIETIVESRNPLAIGVKKADLSDHLRPNCPDRLRPRYERAWQALTGSTWDRVQEATAPVSSRA